MTATAVPGTSYDEILNTSLRVNWRVEDIIGGDLRLDFGRPFLPELFARTAPLDFLTADERRVLNQVRSHTYLYVFGLVEEFILPFVLDHARAGDFHDDARVRAMLAFAAEEAKHIDLFKRFCADFAEGFGVRCEVIGPPGDVAAAVLSHGPLAVALTILHIEWMTQRHFVESVKDANDLDPQFKSLLRNHWLEESQHAKLDVMVVDELLVGLGDAERRRAVDEYFEIVEFLDEGLAQQLVFDLVSFQKKCGRVLTDLERASFFAEQGPANRFTYIGSGMTHPVFLETVERVAPGSRARVEAVARDYC